MREVGAGKRMSEGYQALTEKEKQTLRLIGRGYDAKSMARHLGLSVHTVNERLRYARRKLEVSSSREAARLLLAREGDAPYSLGPREIGEAGAAPDMAANDAPDEDSRAWPALVWAIGGMLIMSLVLATLLLSTTTPAATSSEAAPEIRSGEATGAVAESDVVQAAQQWLALVDRSRWSESWNATGQSFKQLNTSGKWAEVSEQGRVPLGQVLSRSPISQQSVPAPPYGYQMVKFRTDFTHRAKATETITLAREGGEWKVVGYWID